MRPRRTKAADPLGRSPSTPCKGAGPRGGDRRPDTDRSAGLRRRRRRYEAHRPGHGRHSVQAQHDAKLRRVPPRRPEALKKKLSGNSKEPPVCALGGALPDGRRTSFVDEAHYQAKDSAHSPDKDDRPGHNRVTPPKNLLENVNGFFADR